MAILPANCATSVNRPCRDENCIKPKCPNCQKHICPVCRGHYVILAYSDDWRGCNTTCVKISTDDTEPWRGPIKKHKVGE
jgi:hypothetical protein